MLDVPLRQDNTTVGVLCAEHVGGARDWTVDEQNFAISVANLIVVAIVEEERRNALARLAESEARARLIVDTAHDAFIGIDPTGRIVAWNAQAERTFGWTRDEVLGRNLAETIIPPAFREAHTSGMRRFHETGEAPVVNQRLELTALHRSGREFPVELTITSPMRVGERLLLRRVSQGHFRSARARRRAPPREGVGGGRDARQERVPGEHEPRAEDAAQRRARIRAAPPARSDPERRAARGAGGDLASAARSCWI